MTLNTILLISILVAVASFVIYYIRSTAKTSIPKKSIDDCDIDFLTNGVRLEFASVLKENLRDMNLTKSELLKKERLRNELKKAQKQAGNGSKSDKMFIKIYIKDIIQGKKFHIGKHNIDEVIYFTNPSMLKYIDKHEILMHVYNKKYGAEGFCRMISDYNLDAPHLNAEGEPELSITEEQIDYVYRSVMKDYTLTYDDKLEIVVQRIFEKYKGNGAIDMLIDTTLDGISGGISGMPITLFEFTEKISQYKFSYDSIWCMFHGKSIHLAYLSFGSQAELERVTKNVYRYNSAGVLSESSGHITNTMKNGARVSATRPPESESWAFWIRKPDLAKGKDLTALVVDKHNEVPIQFTQWAVKGLLNMIVSGEQGCGKTTFLRSIIKYIEPSLTIRVVELIAELNLRYAYPNRNIDSFIGSNDEKMQEILDFLKKTDGAVTVLGEIATHKATSWFIQNAMVASLMSLATYHSKTAYDLVVSMRNSLLEAGGFSNEKIAEEQVAKVLKLDIHWANVKGHRYIERITEIMPIIDRRYPSEKTDITDIDTLTKMNQNEYYKRMTDRQLFETRDIIRYNSELDSYVFVSMPSAGLQEAIKTRLTYEEEVEFEKMLEEISKINYSYVKNEEKQVC